MNKLVKIVGIVVSLGLLVNCKEPAAEPLTLPVSHRTFQSNTFDGKPTELFYLRGNPQSPAKERFILWGRPDGNFMIIWIGAAVVIDPEVNDIINEFITEGWVVVNTQLDGPEIVLSMMRKEPLTIAQRTAHYCAIKRAQEA